MNPILLLSALRLSTNTTTLSTSTVTNTQKLQSNFGQPAHNPIHTKLHLVGVDGPLHVHVHSVPQLTKHYEHELDTNFGEDHPDTDHD